MVYEVKTYEALPGSDIRESIKELLQICKDKRCNIKINCNSVDLEIYEGSSVEQIMSIYLRKQEERSSSDYYTSK